MVCLKLFLILLARQTDCVDMVVELQAVWQLQDNYIIVGYNGCFWSCNCNLNKLENRRKVIDSIVK